MTKAAIAKRLATIETTITETEQIRVEAEAREVTSGRMQEIMQGTDAARRQGDEGYANFLKTLSDGELLRLHRERGKLVSTAAEEITPEHIEKLLADGVPIERFTDAELHALVADFKDDDPFDWSALPEDVLNAIATDPETVDFEDLARRYPNPTYNKEAQQ